MKKQLNDNRMSCALFDTRAGAQSGSGDESVVPTLRA
jgi:hypothetical protein